MNNPEIREETILHALQHLDPSICFMVNGVKCMNNTKNQLKLNVISPQDANSSQKAIIFYYSKTFIIRRTFMSIDDGRMIKMLEDYPQTQKKSLGTATTVHTRRREHAPIQFQVGI